MPATLLTSYDRIGCFYCRVEFVLVWILNTTFGIRSRKTYKQNVGLVAVYITSVTVENLLSFKNSTFNFKKYNVIVGPNNSGKTNLVRILQKLVTGSINDSFFKQDKFLGETKYQVRIAVETNNVETRDIIRSFVGKTGISQSNLNQWKKFTMIWGLRSRHRLDPVWPIIYFENKTVVFVSSSDYRVSRFEPPDVSEYKERLSELCSLDDKQLRDLFYESRIEISHNDNSKPRPEAIRRAFFKDYKKHEGFTEEFRPVGSWSKINDDALGKPQDRNPPGHIPFPAVIFNIVNDSFVRVGEMHPTPKNLITSLYNLKNQNEAAYKHIQKLFTDIFSGVKIRVEQEQPDNPKQNVFITDHQRTFSLTDSASGYLETIHVLYEMMDGNERTIFLDEPEVHLHPMKIKRLHRMLHDISEKNNNQVTIITHSPEFIDHKFTLNPQHMISVVRKPHNESQVASPLDCNIDLKPHVLEPSIFFVDAVFLVEGPSDELAIRAISDGFDGIFEKHNIVVVNCGGVGNIKPYTGLLEAYSIPYYGLADTQYERGDDQITVLDEDLEHELAKTTLDGTLVFGKSKLAPQEAYQYVCELLDTKEGFERLKETEIWSSVGDAMEGQGISMNVFENKYKK